MARLQSDDTLALCGCCGSQAGVARRLEGERPWSEQAGVGDEADESADSPESHAFVLWAAQVALQSLLHRPTEKRHLL